MKIYLLLCFISVFTFANGQSNPNILEFSLLRQNDSVSITETKNNYQNLKSIALGKENQLSLGGSFRFQTEAYINEQFNNKENQNDYWFLSRAMFHTHLKLGTKFEFFGELNSSLITGKENISPVQKDTLNINQLFVNYQINNHFSYLIGRQNMRLGSGRLIDVREGPNVRLSFDMLQLKYKDYNTKITGFYAIPVQQQQGVWDNNAFNTSETLSALYWTQNWTKSTSTDIYVLYKKELNKIWNSGMAHDKRASLGLRHFGTWKGLTYNNEFVYQAGKFGNQNISAWTISFHIEKAFKTFNHLSLGLKTEAISGDKNTNNNAINTFDALYPRGAYFGRVARFGPSNLIDIHPYLTSKIGPINIELDYVAFWRFSKHDGLYNPALILEYASNNNKRFIANQIGAIASYKVNQFISVELESNIIYPGAFLKAGHQKDPLYHFVLTTEIKF